MVLPAAKGWIAGTKIFEGVFGTINGKEIYH